MKRQKLRKALVICSFLLFPITMYYLSPYLIIMGASEGVIAGSFVVFGLMFLVSLFLGRAFCGWVCPAGGLQECCVLASDRRAKGGWLNWIKYLIWVPWISIIAIAAVNAGGLKKIDFLYQTKYGISISEPKAYIIFYAVILLIVIMAFTSGRRSFCHYVCWMAPFMIIGSKIKNKLGYPSLHLKGDKDKCIGCSSCTKKCPMSLEVMDMVQRSDMQNTECILCGECIDACPKKAIKYAIKGR